MRSVMKLSACLWAGVFLFAAPVALYAQSLPDWAIMTAPSDIALPSKVSKKLSAKSSPETTQSIGVRPVDAAPAIPASQGWNVSSDADRASLFFARDGKFLPVGFTCQKGDGFVHFLSPPTTHAAGKRILVLLKSLNGTIRIETKVGLGQPRMIESEIPVRTSSLVFVLTPKKGEATATIGGAIEKIPALASDVKLLRFQSLCDQPIITAADE